MSVTRRHFLVLSSAALSAFALDPDRLLWVPGAKTIFLPTATADRYFRSVADTYGRIARGDRISVRQYNALVGVETVWRDHANGTTTTVQFPQVDIGKFTRGVRLTVPSCQDRVVSMAVHRG